MAFRATKPAPLIDDLLSPLPPKGPELDMLIKAMVAEADDNPAPGIPMAAVFGQLRQHHAAQFEAG